MIPQMKPCPECRQRFVKRRWDQGFCSTACNTTFSKRELARARRVYRALYHWRLKRKGPFIAECLRFVCNEVASWIREDREAQRLPPPMHDFTADRGHQRRPRRAVARVVERPRRAA